tara:strand:+ start:857 stop:1033 length:177 start_codon:yes stop_codon:yes gene_type:complete
MNAFLYSSKPEIPLWLFIVLVLVLAVIIGWLVNFLPNKGKGHDDYDPLDGNFGDTDFF